MDVWFDSGVTHAAVCDERDSLHWPADLYLEGADQYRGWFQSSLLTSIAWRGKAPYKAVATHGWVVDGQGRACTSRSATAFCRRRSSTNTARIFCACGSPPPTTTRISVFHRKSSNSFPTLTARSRIRRGTSSAISPILGSGHKQRSGFRYAFDR